MGQFSCLLKKANPVLIFSQVIHRPKQCRRGNPLRYFYANTAYLGSKALSVTGEAYAQPTSAFTVESGASYTFSAYVKTSGTHASIALYEGETVLAQ